MDKDAFIQMAERADRFSKEHPGAYKFRLLLYTLFGYAFWVVLVMLLLGVIGLAYYVLASGKSRHAMMKLAGGAFFLLIVLIRASRVRFARPEGIEIFEHQAPALFSAIESIRQQLNSPKVDHVLIDYSFNAAVMQYPVLGIFGLYTNYLILGFPFMLIQSGTDFREVLAHELGHLSRSHGLFSKWIISIRRMWINIYEECSRNKVKGSRWILAFIRWYVPRFRAYSFAFARVNEYEANQASALVVGAARAADSTTSVSVNFGIYDGIFWEAVWDMAATQANPPGPYSMMDAKFQEYVTPYHAARMLLREIHKVSNYWDTHPCLSDALAALGQAPRLPGPVKVSAAKQYLGSLKDTLIQEFDDEWIQYYRDKWCDQHREGQQQILEMKQLTEKAGKSSLCDDDLYSLGKLAFQRGKKNLALKCFLALLKRNGENATCYYYIGRILVEQGDARGIAYLDKTMSLDRDATSIVCEMAYGFWISKGDTRRGAPYEKLFAEYLDTKDDAALERGRLDTKDVLIPHGIDAEAIGYIVSQLSGFPAVEKGYLARKQMKHYKEDIWLILGFTIKDAGSQEEVDEILTNVIENIDMPHRFWGVVMDRPITRVYSKKLRHLPDALIYEKAS